MLYVVAGDGTGNLTEIKATLADLREKAVKDDADFWFLVAVKDEPTKTETAIVDWLRTEGIYFEAVGEETAAYEGAQQYHKSKEPYLKLMSLASENKDDGVVVLALFVDPENDVDEDNDLYAAIEGAVQDDIEVRLLNGQMVRLQLATGEEAAEEPVADGDGDIEAEVEEVIEEAQAILEEVEPEQAFTEAEYRKMSVPELQALAKGQGITLRRGASKGDIIAALLAGEVAIESAVETVVVPVAASAPAMVVIHVNGGVHVKPVTVEEALAMLQ